MALCLGRLIYFLSSLPCFFWVLFSSQKSHSYLHKLLHSLVHSWRKYLWCYLLFLMGSCEKQLSANPCVVTLYPVFVWSLFARRLLKEFMILSLWHVWTACFIWHPRQIEHPLSIMSCVCPAGNHVMTKSMEIYLGKLQNQEAQFFFPSLYFFIASWQ